MGFKFFSVLSPSTPVVTDIATLLDSLNCIKIVVIDFQERLESWDGGPLGALSIISKSNTVISTVNHSTTLGQSAVSPSLDEAIDIIASLQQMTTLVGITIDTAILAKPKFEATVLLGVLAVIAILRRMHGASKALSSALMSKAPAEKLDASRALDRELRSHFVRAFAAFGVGDECPPDENLTEQQINLNKTPELSTHSRDMIQAKA